MFGLEGNKKRDEGDFVFDLEQELKDPQRGKELRTLAEQRRRELKELLRSGGDQASFEQLGILLTGYSSLLKVIARVQAKK